MSAKLEAPNLGFTTEEALTRLYDDINDVLKHAENKFLMESYIQKVKYSFMKPYENPLGWFPLLMTFFTIIILFIIKAYYTSTLLLTIFVITFFCVLRENNLRRTEIHRKVRQILCDLELAKRLANKWLPENYPNLCSPLSPCVTLQWTYRDGRIVNLPWALLVRGDFIVIRPGQIAPGLCIEVNGRHKFKCGETYGLSHPIEPPLKPTARPPLPDLVCIMESTPYLENLKTTFDNFLKRPSTIYNQQRYFLITKSIQQWGILFSLLLTLSSAVLQYSGVFQTGKGTLNWKEIFLEGPICGLMPILPLMFPIMWIATNLWGIAKLETLLSIPQPLFKSEQQKSFQEDLDTPTYEYENVRLPMKSIFKNWIGLCQGSSELLGRSSSVVQVFGSITALCCVDKKGILSWPNPTAEKVFFLRDSSTDKTSKLSKSSLDSDNESTNEKNTGTIAEVLDLTHDQHSPFRLEFDDHEWKSHLNSLKPLGLAILVNTCCPMTQAHYAQFCGHVSAVAMLDKDLIPVTNRYAIVESRLNSFMHGRCLCELAKQIGFTPAARDIFNLEGQIASYMHLQPDVVKRDIRFARQLHIASKVKVPFPHCLSVVMRETSSGSLQLLTQGTADIVLDCCDDFWNGKDLRPLGAQERKRAQDFYQRSALTAYCTAFAYRPLRHGIYGALGGGQNCETAYLELPPESKYRMLHNEKLHCDYNGQEHHNLHQSISSDSLLFNDNKEDDITDVEGCFEMQCHQVFIGMVTMQYQAQTDIVQLIEHLDRACIRFVHFSKENELRSRVFSEKMGLESGWNCHISLLSEENSTFSSPKSSRNFENQPQSNTAINDDHDQEYELNKLLPNSALESTKNLSSSAPGAISNEDCNLGKLNPSSASTGTFTIDLRNYRSSKDSAMEDENCRSISCLTDSTEQSAPINFDMSNRAKLPRGIENIRPHLENVDNVPLLVSLFTDCSAEATREMLYIMQSYGEIVVCIGSSASNANAEIFLQADCSIGVEPLYPQVCQEIPAYTETNLLNNGLRVQNSETTANKWFTPPTLTRNTTISPINLSRMLNSVSCSISVCRDDTLSIVNIIELSRRFSNGLWSCIQYWVCCACSLAMMNSLCAWVSLPPLFTPFTVLYLMCIAVPIMSITLLHVDSLNSQLMNRSTGKKQTKFDSRVFAFVIGCYGCKFLSPILIMILSYCTFMSYPIALVDTDLKDFTDNLNVSRNHILFAVIIHFVIISLSFVHRDHSIWQKNPLTNIIWLLAGVILIVFHAIIYIFNIFEDETMEKFSVIWPIILFLFLSVFITFAITEICKWEELKFNARNQRRARLDFGTKLGMNSPF